MFYKNVKAHALDHLVVACLGPPTSSYYTVLTPQVGFAELKETADDRANIGGTIIGAPIVGQQLA